MTRRGLTFGLTLVGIALASASCSSNEQSEVDETRVVDLAAIDERLKQLEAVAKEAQQSSSDPVTSPAALAQRLDTVERSVHAWKSQAGVLQQQQAEVRRMLQLLPLDFRLDMKLSLQTTGTLEQILAQIATLIATPIRIQSEDLGEARIPRIRDIDLSVDEQPARQVLAELLIKANPDPTEPQSPADPKLLLVYVVANNLGGEIRQEILVTTRKRAGQRGVMPAVFKTAE